MPEGDPHPLTPRPGESEAEFIARYRALHLRPSLAVDVVVLTVRDQDLKVLLVRRKDLPFRGHWALPGSFVAADEGLDDAARRALEGKAGVRGVYLEQLYAFGKVNRDPRARVVSVAYYALVSADRAVGAATAEDARWFSVVQELPRVELAFDHAEILEQALARIRSKLQHAPIAFQLLPEVFTLSELQRVYEIVLGRKLDKRNFRAKVLGSGLLALAPGRRVAVGRPARLYRFAGQGELGLEQRIVRKRGRPSRAQAGS